jgi:hypothetical protein
VTNAAETVGELGVLVNNAGVSNGRITLKLNGGRLR